MTAVATSTPTSTDPRRQVSRIAVAAAVAGVIAVWTALSGPVWTYVPAQPQLDLPAMGLTFGDLATAATTSPSAIQSAYFGWLAWVFAVLTSLLALWVLVGRNRLAALATVAAAVAQLIVTVLAVKGPLTWSVFFEGVPNIRVGAVLALGGIVLLFLTGAVVAARRSGA